jgi:hypothetical protein
LNERELRPAIHLTPGDELRVEFRFSCTADSDKGTVSGVRFELVGEDGERFECAPSLECALVLSPKMRRYLERRQARERGKS